MMTLAANQQKMYYSLQAGEIPVYETDEEGNIIYYEDDEGNKIALETGETTTGYTKPTEFLACINNKLNEVVWQDYGIDDSTNYAQILVSKGALPLKAGSVIWKKSEIAYKDNDNTIPDESSADYTVKGVADEGLNFDLFLLKRNVK